jgi:anti-sigma B factor antagonist
MKLSYEDFNNISIVTLSGEFTADDVDSFRRAMTDRLAAGAHHLVFDVECLDQIDSAGLEALLWLQQQLNRQGGQLRLVKVDSHLQAIFTLTRLERRFEQFDKVELAVRSVR